MGRFSKAMGEPEEITIKYENGSSETLKLKPLGYEDVNDLLLIGSEMGNKLSDETIERMKNVVFKTLKSSYPDEPENEIKEFTARNFIALIPAILNLNFRTGKVENLEKIRGRLDAGKVPSAKAG